MSADEKKQSREIDGWSYEVTKVPFGVGRPALQRFLRIVAPVLGKILAEGKPGGYERAIHAALPMLAGIVGDIDVDYFTKIFGPATEVTGLGENAGRSYYLDTKNLPIHFEGRYGAFYRWLAFSLEVNFAGFFGGLTSRTPDQPGAANPSSSSAMSGGSGGF